MRKKFFLFVLFIFLSTVYQTQAQAINKNSEALIARQKDFFEKVVNRKYDLLDKVLAADYIGTYSAGIIDKAHESKDLREFNLTKYQMSNIKTAFPNDKTGLISFKLHVEVLVDGKTFTEDDFINCVWTKESRKWRLSAQTAVKVISNNG